MLTVNNGIYSQMVGTPNTEILTRNPNKINNNIATNYNTNKLTENNNQASIEDNNSNSRSTVVLRNKSYSFSMPMNKHPPLSKRDSSIGENNSNSKIRNLSIDNNISNSNNRVENRQ